MTAKPYRFHVTEARSFSHPFFPTITKHTFFVQALVLPAGMPTGANAREAVGMNRRVYKDVTESLRANESHPGSFDLMNLGITIIADDVKVVDKKTFDVFIKDEDGIVNGAHTARIIQNCIEDGTVNHDQYIEVRIITGIDKVDIPGLKSDIAKGQNTAIAVKEQSIFDTQGVFDSLKHLIKDQSWSKTVAWRESDVGDYDVRELVSVLEAINVIDFPNGSSSHPIQAYEKWSLPLQRYADDFKANVITPSRRKYAALEPLLLDALELYDRIRHDFRPVYNEHVSSGAGRMRIVEEAPKSKKLYDFPFSDQAASKYRLTKGAAFPILAGFRNFVEYDEKSNKARWVGGFENVRQMWMESAPELVRETAAATREIGRTPDIIGKSRNHWASIHRLVENRLLRLKLKEMQS